MSRDRIPAKAIERGLVSDGQILNDHDVYNLIFKVAFQALILSIINGFLVGVGDSVYVLPLEMVEECMELDARECKSDDKHYLTLRGEVLPYLRLYDHFELEGRHADRESVMVVRYGGQKTGLVGDKLMGKFRAVIKRLGKVFSKTKGIGGFTILGSGDVALVLDVAGLLHQVEFHQQAALPAE